MAPTGENTIATKCRRSCSGEDTSTRGVVGSIDAWMPASVSIAWTAAPTWASLLFVKGDNSPKKASAITTKARQMRYPITCLMGAHTFCCRPKRRGRYPGKYPEIFNLSKHPHAGSRPSVFAVRYYPRTPKGLYPAAAFYRPLPESLPEVYGSLPRTLVTRSFLQGYEWERKRAGEPRALGGELHLLLPEPEQQA